MGNPITTAQRLVALSDPTRNSSENERDSAARALAKMLLDGKVKLAAPGEPGSTVPGAGFADEVPGSTSGLREAFDREMAVRRGMAAQQAFDVQLCEAVERAVSSWVQDRPEPIWKTYLAPQFSRVLRSVVRLAVTSVKTGAATTHDAESDRAMKELARTLGSEHELKSQQRYATLSRAIEDLFHAEPEQPGADVIARKVGRSAADVRERLKLLIEWKQVRAVGNGRSRRYRWIGRTDR